MEFGETGKMYGPMDGCVFCGIVSGKIPSHKIAEDQDFVAFLGIFPKYPGMTVIVSKEHKGSYLYKSLTDEELTSMHLFSKKVAGLLDKALNTERCMELMEGLEVDHAHLKLFPRPVGVMDALGEGKIRADEMELEKVAEKILQIS